MSMNPQISTNTIKQSSLLEDGASLCTRLANILADLENMGDVLHGSSPRDASVAPPDPQPSVRRHIDKANQLSIAIDDALNRIKSRL